VTRTIDTHGNNRPIIDEYDGDLPRWIYDSTSQYAGEYDVTGSWLMHTQKVEWKGTYVM